MNTIVDNNENTGLSCPCEDGQDSHDSQEGQGLGYSFWGKVWRVAAVAAASAFGGPVGGVIGALLAAYWSLRSTTEYTIAHLEMINEKYPLNPSQEEWLINYLTNQFLPTVDYLTKLIDAEIEMEDAQNRGGGLVNSGPLEGMDYFNPSVIEKTNIALKAVSVMKANNDLHLVELGHSNATQNKVAFMNYFLNKIEKAIHMYVRDNAKESYILISETQLVSNVMNTSLIAYSWRGKTVSTTVSSYVLKGSVIQSNQTIIDVVDVDLSTETPPTSGETEVIINDGTSEVVIVTEETGETTVTNEVVTEPKKSKALMKFGFAIAGAVVLKKAFFSKK